MNGSKTICRFTLALSLAVAGLAVLFGFLGSVQKQVYAAAPVPAVNPVDGRSGPHASPRLEPLVDSVHAPVDAPPAAPLGGVIDTSSVYTVCSAGCDFTTVQAAVDAAADGDTIKVAQGAYTDNDADGYVVEISKSLTIQGGYITADWVIPNPDGHPTVLDGANADQVVRIAAGNPTLEGFRIWRGSATQGAGVYIAGGSPLLRRNRIYENVATNDGGGVYIVNGSPVLENNLIYDNEAAAGAGVYALAGSVAIRYNTFHDNTATGQGGGVYLASGTPVISASVIVSNTAGSSGGGIYGSAAIGDAQDYILYNDVFGNVPQNYDVGGAGQVDTLIDNISEDPRFVNLSGANFRLRADSPCIGRFGTDYPDAGPGDDYDGYSRPFGAYWDMGAHEFYTGACFARIESGRVYTAVQEAVDDSTVADGDEVQVAGWCTGSNSSVVLLTKSILLQGGYTLTNWSYPDPDNFPTTLDGEGERRVIRVGVALMDNADPTIRGFNIYHGQSSEGGSGIYLYDRSDAIIEHNRIYSNSAVGTGIGGGLYIYGSSPVVRDNDFYSNTADMGGAIYVDGVKGGDVTIEHNQIYRNSAASNGGGGIGVGVRPERNEGDVRIQYNAIFTNVTDYAHSNNALGGGIKCTGGYCVIQGNTIYSNTGRDGGGIAAMSAFTATVRDNRIYGNRAIQGGIGGGGIYASDMIIVQNNVISGNIATGSGQSRGGGVFVLSKGTVDGNRIYGNEAVQYGGGILLYDHNDAIARNNLVYTNTAAQGGGIHLEAKGVVENNTVYDNGGSEGVYANHGNAYVRNNIVVGNAGVGIGGGTNSVANYNNVWGNGTLGCGTCDIGNISADPQFMAPLASDFHLQSGSPCRDAVLTTTHSAYDFDNYARPFGQYADMGAHEYYAGACFARLSTGGGVYTTVQAAVDSATAGMSVLVAGTCEGSDAVVSIGKSLELRGGYTRTNWTSPLSPTILDAQGQNRVVTINGGVTVTVGELVIQGASGAGIYVASSLDPTIQNVIGYDNGVGFALASGGSPRLYNNTFVLNTHGISVTGSGSPVISNTIVVSNTGHGIVASGGSTPILAYNDVWGNGANYSGVSAGATDISKAPFFEDPAGPVFRLQSKSPCIHGGAPNTGVTIDFEGDARPDGTGQGQRYDIGADEATEYYGVALGPDHLEADRLPGTQVEYMHYVTNTGTFGGRFSVTCTVTATNSQGSVGTWDDDSLTCPTDYYLEVDEVAAVPVGVSVPDDAVSGTQATVFLTATYQSGDLYLFDVASNTTFVKSDWGVYIAPAADQTVDPGQVVVYSHTLSNIGGGPDSFTLTLSSSPWAAVVIPPSPVENLPSGGSIQVSVRITVPIWASSNAVGTAVLAATSKGAAQAGRLYQSVVTDTTKINAIPGDRYVATWGDDYVSGAVGLNGCRVYSYPCGTIGQALGQAYSGELIKVEQGAYYENKLNLATPVILRGGYTRDDGWTTFDPVARPTIIDAYNADPGKRGRVLYIVGDAIVEGFTLQNGLNSGYGGAVYIVGGAEPILRNNVIRDNVARTAGVVFGRGGGVYNAGGNPTLDRNIFINNTGDGFGGGFYNKGGVADIWNNVFYGNDSPEGGGFYNEGGNPRVWHNTFVSNTAGEGGGLYLAGGTPIVSNTIVVSNVAGTGTGGGIYWASGSVDYVDVWHNTPNDYTGMSRPIHDVNADPRFVDAAGENFHLLRESPCFDTGDGVDMSVLAVDLDGQPRHMNVKPDIGADEYQKPDVALSPGFAQVGERGKWTMYTHYLTNTGNYDDSYLLTWYSDWEVMVEGSATQPVTVPVLASGQATSVAVAVRVPEDVLSTTARTIIFTATSQVAIAQGETDIYDTSWETIADTIIAGLDVQVSLVKNLNGWGDVGVPVLYRHTLMNTGNYTDTFDITLEDSRISWDSALVAPGPQVTLGMGESVEVSVEVEVPTANILDVNYTWITATSQADSDVFAVVTDTTVAYRRLGVGLAPDRAVSVDPGFYSVVYTHVLTNSGNYTDTYVFTFTSEMEWDLEIKRHDASVWQTPPMEIEIGTWQQTVTPLPTSVVVDFRVTVPAPPDAFGGWQDTMVITATSVDSATLSASVTDLITITPKEGVNLWYSYDQFYSTQTEPPPDYGVDRALSVKRIVVGALPTTVAFTHTVYNNNTSNITDTYNLAAVSLQWPVSVLPTQIVDLGWHKKVTDVLAIVTVPAAISHPPIAPATTVLVTATSQFNPDPPDGLDVVTDVVIVNQWVGVAWVPDGLLHAPPPGPYSYTRILSNTGNYTDSYTLSGAPNWGGSVGFSGGSPTPDIGPATGRTITVEAATVPFWPCYTTSAIRINAASRTPQAGTAGYDPTDSLTDTFQVDPVYYVDVTPAFANPVGTGLPKKLHYLSTDTAQIQETYARSVTNTGNCSNTFDVDVTTADFTPLTFEPASTGVLSPSTWWPSGGSMPVAITITLPQVDPAVPANLVTGTVVFTADGQYAGDSKSVTDIVVVNQHVSVTLEMDETETITKPGVVNDLYYTHTLVNTGNYEDVFVLAARNSDGWNVYVEGQLGQAQTPPLAAGEAMQVDVQVIVPADVYTLTNRTWVTATSLTAQQAGDGVVVHNATATVTDTTLVRRPHATWYPELGYTRYVTHGTSYTYVHTLLNDGGVIGTYDITYDSSKGWAQSPTPATVNNLQPGDAQTVTLVVAVPYPTPYTEYDVAVVTATYALAYPVAVSDVTTDTTLVPRNVKATLTPDHVHPPVKPGTTIVYTHTLVNAGSYTESFTLSADASFNVELDPPPPSRVENMAPGASVPVTATITIPAYAPGDYTETMRINVNHDEVGMVTRAENAVYVEPITGTRYVDSVQGDDVANNCTQLDGRLPCKTVQHAVNQALPGDTVKVDQGAYIGGAGADQVVQVGKSITLIGGYEFGNWNESDPVAYPTVLDAEGARRVMVIDPGITPTIEGFHMRGGVGDRGAGLFISQGATPTVRLNRIYDNVATGCGGGIYGGSDALLERNAIYENQANLGGGLCLWSGEARVWNSLVYNNDATYGGGVYNRSTPLIWNSTFYNNAADLGDGFYGAGGSLVISNTIIAENAGEGIRVLGAATATLAYNDVWNNGADYAGVTDHPTDISRDPRFANPSSGDLRLTFDSPCINAGEPGVSWPADDYEGNGRPLFGRYDIGAYEYSITSTKSVAGVYEPGETVTYVVQVTNAGAVAHTILVTDTLHEFLDATGFLFYTTGLGNYPLSAGATISWTGVVSGNTTDLITFTAHITDIAGAGVPITNVAWVDSGQTRVAEFNVVPEPGARYVTPDGYDRLHDNPDRNNNCQQVYAPCATVQHAVDEALPGDEVKVAAGVYTDTDGFGQVVNVSKAITLTGGYAPPAWSLSDPVENETILQAQSGEPAVRIGGSVVVAGFHIIGGTPGVNVTGSGDLALSRSWVRNNGVGVDVASGAGYELINNIIVHNTVAGLRTASGSDGDAIHNTFAHNLHGVNVAGTTRLTNTIFSTHTVAVYVTGNAELWNTLWWGNSTNRQGAVVAHTDVYSIPAFVDPGNLDYHIKEESGAIDQGVIVPVVSDGVDIDGEARWVRDYPDLGADEFPSGLNKYALEFAEPGQTVPYTIVLQAKETGLVITDVLPLHVTYVSDSVTCTVPSCAYLPGENAVVWAGDSTEAVTITYQAVLDPWLGKGTIIADTVDLKRQNATRVEKSPECRTEILQVPGPRHVAVAPAGGDTDSATGTDNNCLMDWKPCETIQWAIGQAMNGDTVRVAEGAYTDSDAEVVNVNKAITLTGGYTTTGWLRDVDAYPTYLDGQRARRVVYVAGTVGPVTVDGFHVLNGYVNGSSGAGVYVNSTAVTLVRNRVYSNTVIGASGGGIYLENAVATLDANQVYHNVAGAFGGGVYVQNYARADSLIINNVVVDNQAGIDGDGLGFDDSSRNSVTLMRHNTIADNAEAGVFVYRFTVGMSNTIVAGHTGYGIYRSSSGVVNATHTLWDNNGVDASSGVVNDNPLSGDPMFMDPTAPEPDYHIRPGSDAFDVGVDTSVTTDMDGEARLMGLGPDIGADELRVTLDVIKAADPYPAVMPGEQLTYTIRVTNTGLLTLTVTITDDLPADAIPGGIWVTTAGEIVPDDFRTFVITVQTQLAGTLVNVVTATAQEGATDTYILTSTVGGEPEIAVTPLSLSALLAPNGAVNRTLTIANNGTADLNWSLAEIPTDVGWLGESAASGTVPPLGGSEDVVVGFDATGQTDGVYNATLRITSDDLAHSPWDVPVTLTVCTPVAGASFTYTPVAPELDQAIHFTASVTAGTGVVYTWDFGDGNSASGQFVDHTYTVSDTYTVVMTATNCYGASVMPYSENIVVGGVPRITATPSPLNVTLAPDETATRTLTIGNVAGTMDLIIQNLTETPDVGWLSESLTSGSVPRGGSTQVIVSFDATGLSEAVYNTTLQITSNDPDDSPLNVPVTLTVGGHKIYLPLVLRNS